MIQQPDFAAAQRQAQAVIVEVLVEGVDAHGVGGADDVAHADQVEHLDGRDVVGSGQRSAEALRAVILAVIVLRAIGRIGIVVEADVNVHDHLGRGVPLVEGSHVAERLEGRPGLAGGHGHVDVAVDLLVPVVDAADHGQDLAGAGADDSDGGVGHAPFFLLELGHLGLGLLFGDLLHVQVEGGVDFQPAFVQKLRAILVLELLADVHGKVGGDDVVPLEHRSVDTQRLGVRRHRPRSG